MKKTPKTKGECKSWLFSIIPTVETVKDASFFLLDKHNKTAFCSFLMDEGGWYYGWTIKWKNGGMDFSPTEVRKVDALSKRYEMTGQFDYAMKFIKGELPKSHYESV